ncbi:MAG: U3 snoRNP protein [Icmadophila ericetorum]|nr:U3 snoRNP protein [Icmadophila ericetorum]
MAPGVLLRSPSPSSHTLTASPTHPAPADLHPASHQLLLSTLVHSSHAFLQPSSGLHTAALVLAKRYLDPLAASVSRTQEERLQAARRKRKRKRGEANTGNGEHILRLKQVYLEGLGVDQIWEQARRVLDATCHEVERHFPGILQDGTNKSHIHHGHAVSPNGQPKGVKTMHFDEDGFEVGSSEDEVMEEDDGELEDSEMDYAEGGSVKEKIEIDEDDGPENGFDHEDIMEDGKVDLDNLDTEEDEEQEEEVFVPDKHDLNDGFFSIDEFNRTSEFLEQQDARADDPESDDEEIDWDADPLAAGSGTTNSKGQTTNGNDAKGYNGSEEDGPIFGNADLNAPDTSDEDEDDSDRFSAMEDMDPTAHTNDIKYADFFAPPALPQKRKRRRLLLKTQPQPRTQAQQAENGDDIQRAISAVHRDLFEDDELSDPDADEAPGQDPSTTNRNSNLSTHEKRQLALQKQIRDLEAANVAKRQWTLQGEARAAERPLNSLLEEDLDFERIGKPVPVITKDVSEDIEALIKRRILARDFDEVIKRRPGTLPGTAISGPSTRRGLVDLPQTKDPLSLSEVYEKAHLEGNSEAAPVDPKIAAQHAEIARLWSSVSAKLDALSNFHYKPKPPDLQVTVVSDIAAVRMEDARPSGVGGVGDIGGGERLAPQEVYNPNKEGGGRGEVVLASGLPMQKEEMSREERLRRRRREKERLRKSEDKASLGKGKSKAVGVAVAKGNVKGEKTRKEKESDVVGALKKGGVKIIGKKGELRDMSGKTTELNSGRVGVKSGGGFKL